MFKNRLSSAFLGGMLLVLWATTALVRAEEIPQAPDRWVTDRAGFLSAPVVAELDALLGSFEKESGHQIVVYVDKTTGGVPIEDWAVKIFTAWRVGRKGLDDGLALFIMSEDRKIRIEVGYGLEDRIPDITAGRIINDHMIPAIRNGENDRAVREAVLILIQIISGKSAGEEGAETSSTEGQARAPKRFSAGEIVLAAGAVLFFLILFITNPSLALWLLVSILSGGRGGGGAGGGGFKGGGGRSGGGGASGSW